MLKNTSYTSISGIFHHLFQFVKVALKHHMWRVEYPANIVEFEFDFPEKKYIYNLPNDINRIQTTAKKL